MRLLLTIIAFASLLASGTADGNRKEKVKEVDDGNWVVFNINPRNAIVTVDSNSVHKVRDGVLQLMVPIGTHHYICESPYYRMLSDDFEVNDSTISSVNIDLHPEFAFLSVLNPVRGADIYIDGQKSGRSRAESGRLCEGQHRINVIKGNNCWYDKTVNLSLGEKMTLNIESDGMAPMPLDSIPGLVIPGYTGNRSAEEVFERMTLESGGISVHTKTPGATILINGCEAGHTPAIIKNLHPGIKYRLTVRKEGYRDASRYVEIRTGKVIDLEMKMKKR